jgi:hypothetical protein
MKIKDFDKVLEMWERHILVETLEEYSLEIGDDVPKEFAAIALYLDSSTVRAAGEIQEYYEGYRQAATDILNFMGVELVEDHEMKMIQIKRTATEQDKQELLKKLIWE